MTGAIEGSSSIHNLRSDNDEQLVAVDVNNPQSASKIPAHKSGLICFAANAVLITGLLPYISPFVLPDMDVQLMALGTSTIVLLALLFLAPSIFSVEREDLLILGMGLVCLVYVSPDIAFDNLPAATRACGQIILAFPIYYAVRNLYRYMSPRVFLAVIALYCAALFLQVCFPDVYKSTFAYMLSDTRWFVEEGRGPNGLCTEPSMMGNVCTLFMVSLYFFHRKYWASHKIAARFVVAASCLMLFITKSGTGVVLALIVGAAALFSSSLSKAAKAAILAASLLVLFAIGPLLGSFDSRGASILSGIATNPLSILDEYSFADRLLGIYVGLHQIPDEPFGSLDVRIDPEATNSALNGDVAVHLWPDPAFRSLLIDMRSLRYNNHGTGALVERMGILGVLILATLLYFARGFHGEWVVRAFLLVTLLNASIFISTLWFALGCCVELHRIERCDLKETPHGFIHSLLKGISRRVCTEET